MSNLERRVSGLLHDATSDLAPDVEALVRGGRARGRRRLRRTAVVLCSSVSALAVATVVVPLSLASTGDSDRLSHFASDGSSPSSTTTGGPTRGSDTVTGQVTAASQIHLPLARYLSTAADQEAYFAAVNMEQKRCAAGFGLSSTLPVAQQPTELESATARRYGIVDASEVARYGYQMPPMSSGAAAVQATRWDPDERELAVMSAREPDGSPVTQDPVTGKTIPDGGCAAEGFRLIDKGQSSPALNDVVEELLGQAWSRTIADPQARAAARKWSACMAVHGHDFQHRWDAAGSVGGRPKSEQIATARQDLGCARETGYIDAWYAIDSAYQNQLIKDHQAELEVVLSEHAAVMSRVHHTLRAR